MTDEELKLKILEWIGVNSKWNDDDELISLATKIFGFVRVKAFKEEIKEKTYLEKILSLSVDTLELSRRSKHCLKNERFDSIGELIKRTPGSFKGIPNFGNRSLNEVKETLLRFYGITWQTFGNDMDNSSEWFDEQHCRHNGGVIIDD